MKQFFFVFLLAVTCQFSSLGAGPMIGLPGTICVGHELYVTDSPSVGGTWSTSDSSIAIIEIFGWGISGGIIRGVGPGTVTISYTDGTGTVTNTLTVNPNPAPITGPSSFCLGTTITLYDATPGGAWSCSGTATMGAAGTITGITAGLADIRYMIMTGCYVDVIDTVAVTDSGIIGGPSSVCVGATIPLIDTIVGGSAITGGTWSSSDPAVATVDPATGIVTGMTAGTTVISYSVSGPCGLTAATRIITVSSVTSPGSITGTASVTAGLTTNLYDASPGGTWSSGNVSIATIGSSYGVVTGVSPGTAAITYAVSGCSGIAYATAIVTVNTLDGISGHVNFSGTPVYTNVKVWLIAYNPSSLDLEAIDSVSVYCSGTSVYYQFTGIPTDSFRIKAAIYDSFSTGYMPTYHTSAYYWHDADVVYHTSGSSDINEDINMEYGSTTTGTGFISGNVLTGANKGTSGSIPVTGLGLYLFNTSTLQMMQRVSTDAGGAYSFNNLPYGTYTVFPDSINYLTTPYASITLTSGSPSFTGGAFIQHTISKTITPVTEAVQNHLSISSIAVFPNPIGGKLTIQWTKKTAEKVTIIISDLTGRDVYNATINMNEGTGSYGIDLSGFSNGLYIVKIKSASLNYDTKIEIQH